MDEHLHELERRMALPRGEVNFTCYMTSASFQSRKKKWPKKMKEPCVSRENWWTHADYYKSPQMPEFHTHFRVEMGNTLKAIYDAYNFHTDSNRKKRERQINLALNIFRESMSSLSFHVSIEERRVFPMIISNVKHDDIDLSFLYDDHKTLHTAEERLMKSLHQCLDECQKGIEDEANDQAVELALQSVVSSALAYDSALLTHLGEEEELVVPITLLYGMNF